MPPSRVDRSAAIVLLVAVCAAYFNAFAGTAQFDDHVLLADPALATLGGWLAAQPGPRPLLTLSYALNNVSGLGLAGWHAANVSIHVIASLLAYAVLRRLTHRDDIVFRDQRLAAFLAAAVFALHPAQTEAVTYLSGRATSLAAALALLSMLLWLRGREYDDPRDLYLRSPLAFVAALAANEFVVVLPLALLLAARLQSHRGWWVRIALRESALHWVLAFAALGAALALPQVHEPMATAFGAPDVAADLLARASAIAYLAGHLVRPDWLNADPGLVAAAPLDAAHIAAAAALVASLVAGLVSWRRYPVLAFAILWFLLWLAPPIFLDAQPGAANDRQLYLALIGPALGIARVLLRLSPRILQWAFVPVLLAGLVFATHGRNRVYGDEVAYWGDVAAKAPHNARAQVHLGNALALACKPVEAARALASAHALDPSSSQYAQDLVRSRAAALGRQPACPGLRGPQTGTAEAAGASATPPAPPPQ